MSVTYLALYSGLCLLNKRKEDLKSPSTPTPTGIVDIRDVHNNTEDN